MNIRIAENQYLAFVDDQTYAAFLHPRPETPADPEYKRFLENYSCDEEKSMANPETLLGEIEAKTRELIGTVQYAQINILSVSRFSCIYVAATLNISILFGFSQTDNTAVGVYQK